MKAERREKLVKFYKENADIVKEAISDKPSDESRKALNELVASLVNEELKEYDLTQYLFETTRDLSAKDKQYIRSLKGVNVYWVGYGGDVLTQVVDAEIYEIPKAFVAGKARYSSSELAQGFVSSVTGLIDEITAEIAAQVQKYAADLFTAGCAGEYTYVANSNTLESVLGNVIDMVYENTQKDTVYILGRRSTLRAVSALGVSEVTKEERDKYGIIARYHDAELKPVPLIGRNKAALLPENRLFICATDCGRFDIYGDPEPDELKIEHFTYEVIVRQAVGGVLVPSWKRAAVINIE